MQQDVAFVGLWRKSWMTLKNNKTLLFDTIWYTRRTIDLHSPQKWECFISVLDLVGMELIFFIAACVVLCF